MDFRPKQLREQGVRTQREGPRISSDGDDRRVFGGVKFSMPGFFGQENQPNIFFLVACLLVTIFLRIQNNLKIRDSACVRVIRPRRSANKVHYQTCFCGCFKSLMFNALLALHLKIQSKAREIWHRIFCGFVGSPKDFFCVVNFAPIRTCPSPKIRSTPLGLGRGQIFLFSLEEIVLAQTLDRSTCSRTQMELIRTRNTQHATRNKQHARAQNCLLKQFYTRLQHSRFIASGTPMLVPFVVILATSNYRK